MPAPFPENGRPAARFPARSLVLGPVAAALAGIALFSVMDALMKRASLVGGVYSALLARSLIGAALLTPVWRLRGGRMPGWPVLRLHAARGLLAAGMAATFFWGLVRMPMAQAMALSFIAPLIALWLAAALLGEKVRRAAILAALLGIAGVAVIAAARLRGAEHTPAAGWGIAAILCSAVLYAANLVLQRRQAQLAAPVEVALFQNGVVALALMPAFPILWRTPDMAALRDIAGAAVMASAALMLLAFAYARREAQTLVPIEYTAFGWAALAGWTWFGEAVTPATLAGLVLILGGVWLGTRNGASGAAAPG